MADERVLARIAAWEAAGVIDAETAARLREAEAPAPQLPPDLRRPGERRAALAAQQAARVAAVAHHPGLVPPTLAAFFGPPVSIAEVFAYVGAGFLLAAWRVLTANLFVDDAAAVMGWLVPAGVLACLGVLLARRSERERRAGGIAFALAAAYLWPFAASVVAGRLDPILAPVAASGVVVTAAITFRRLYAAAVTHVAALVAAVGLAAALLGWLDAAMFGATPTADQVDAAGAARPIIAMAWWLMWALAFGLVALGERGRALHSPGPEEARAAASRRTSATRFVAGSTAVLGVAYAAMLADQNGRILPVWSADLMVLVVAAVLLGIAVRFGSSGYLYPAALGAIVAFTDLNSTYVADRMGTADALLVEGAALILVGLAADRVRRGFEASHAALQTALTALDALDAATNVDSVEAASPARGEVSGAAGAG